jgi:hypothetical protein
LQHSGGGTNADVLLGHFPEFDERPLSGCLSFCCKVVAADCIERASRLGTMFCGLVKTLAQVLHILFQRQLASGHVIDIDGCTFLTQLIDRQSVAFLSERAHDPDAFARQFAQLIRPEDRALELTRVFRSGCFLKVLNFLASFVR